MESLRLGADFSECIKLGILHSPSGRFLTAEVFNNEINVSGTALRRRQVWTVLIEHGRPQTIYLQSHLGRFLSADKDGRVNGAATTPGKSDCCCFLPTSTSSSAQLSGNSWTTLMSSVVFSTTGADERFTLEFSPQPTGEWAFRSETHGFYLTGSDTNISCFSKTPVWWSVRLAIHPQVRGSHSLASQTSLFVELYCLSQTHRVKSSKVSECLNCGVFCLFRKSFW
ncbi:hypothetical protein FGIG_05251 [Fasciola gigantica]|uniref:Fascin-like domain-containing protein n=1 Tax=Fasciola gigantica TaxID=46835 RepID=A0A504YW96_FASGI|nr:hypothetical protein FGIG_05251 [Fasciola gigantica]